MARLHHANIRISDPDASLAFYAALGLKHVGTAALAPGYTLLYLGGSDGNATVELVVNDTTDAAYDRSTGSGHLGVEVEDLDAVLANLAKVGVEPEGSPEHPLGRTDLGKVAFVSDPDGVRVELLQGNWQIPTDTMPEGVVSA